MNTSKANSLTFDDAMRIIVGQRWMILLCLVVSVLPVAIYNQLAKPVFKGTASMILESPRNSIDSFGAFQSGLTGSRTISEIQELKSRSMAEAVAELLPPAVEHFYRQTISHHDEAEFQRKLVDKIQKSIRVAPVKESEVLKIEFDSNDAAIAMTITNLILQIYESRNLEMRRKEISGARREIEEQLALYQQELQKSETHLRDYKEYKRIAVLDKESEELLKRLTSAEVLHNEVKSNREATRRRLAFIQEKIATQRQDLIPTITKITSPSLQKLKEQLVDLDVQYTTWKAQGYDDEHPKMRKLQDEINRLRATLTADALKIAKGENLIDPISQIHKYLEEAVSLEVDLQSLEARAQTLRQAIAHYESGLSVLPEKEQELARLIRAKNVNEKIYTMLLEKREEARISEAAKIGSVRIIDYARLPEAPYRPRKLFNLIAAAFAGLMIGIGSAFFMEIAGTVVRSPEKIEELIGHRVISTIPQVKLLQKSKQIVFEDQLLSDSREASNKGRRPLELRRNSLASANIAFCESLRVLRTTILDMKREHHAGIFLTTSFEPQEGKSTVAANLAVALAQVGRRVLLVDGDLRRPSLHRIFSVALDPGLTDIITSVDKTFSDLATHDMPLIVNAMIERAPANGREGKGNPILHIVEEREGAPEQSVMAEMQEAAQLFINDTYYHNVAVLTAGSEVSRPGELIESRALPLLLRSLSRQFDFVLVDSPPTMGITDALVMSRFAHRILLIMESGRHSQKTILWGKRLLEKAGAPIAGIVLSKVPAKADYNPYSYYCKYYAHQR